MSAHETPADVIRDARTPGPLCQKCQATGTVAKSGDRAPWERVACPHCAGTGRFVLTATNQRAAEYWGAAIAKATQP